MRLENLYIAGIGTADVDTVEISEAVTRGWIDAEEALRTGLRSVTVAGSTPAPDLAVEAAKRALHDSGHSASDFVGLFHTNIHAQGPEGWSPQHYINRQTIDQPIASIGIHNGCAGLFSILRVAAAFLPEAGRCVLVSAADNFGTPLVDRWKASSLFVLGDGGGAMVLSTRRGFARITAIGAASNPGLEQYHRGGESLFPPSPTLGKVMNIDDRISYANRLAAAGELPSLGVFSELLSEAVKETLQDAGASIDDITRVVHDGFNLDALNSIFLEPLGIEDARSTWEHTQVVGHTGPVDHIRGLEYLWRRGGLGAGDLVLMISGAPGMEAACAVVEILETAA